MNKNNQLINVFNYTIEALEEYIEKIGYPGFKKQIFDKSINSPDRSPEDLADDFFAQLYCLKAMISINRKKTGFSHQEVQKIFYQWIDVAGIRGNNCSKSLKHYLFTVNEVLEGRGENFVQQTDEKINSSSEEADPEDKKKLFNLYQQELHNPSEKKEVNIQGNAETGKEIFQQIASSLSDSDHQNFRFYTPGKNNKNEGLSWSAKLAIGGISLIVLGLLILLIVKISKKK